MRLIQPALRPDSCRLDLDAMKFRAIISSSQQPGQPVQEIWRGAMGWKTWMIWGKSQTDEQMFQLRWLRTLNQKLDDEDWGTGKKGWEGNSHVHSLVNRDVSGCGKDHSQWKLQIGALVGQSCPKIWDLKYIRETFVSGSIRDLGP